MFSKLPLFTFILLVSSVVQAVDAHNRGTTTGDHLYVPERDIVESKIDDGVLLDLERLTSRGNFFRGICDETNDEGIVAIRVSTPFKSIKKSTDSLVKDLVRTKMAGPKTQATRVSRIFLGPEFRATDGSYNGVGPETVCLKVEGKSGAELCSELERAVRKFDFGFKYAGCFASQGKGFSFGTDQLKEFQQLKFPHNEESSFATAYITIEHNRFDEAKQLLEASGLTIPSTSGMPGVWELPLGTDTRAEFDRLRELSLQPNSPFNITSRMQRGL